MFEHFIICRLQIITSLASRLCFRWRWFVWSSVLLSVCLLATLLKKGMNELRWNFMEGFRVIKETCDYILVAIRITMLTVQSEVQPLFNKLRADFDEIFRIALQRYKKEMNKFGGDQDHHADSPNQKSEQYGVTITTMGNEYLGQGGLRSLSALV